MTNISITNNDLGAVCRGHCEFLDDVLAVAGAGTIKEGTILARHAVSGKLIPYVKGGESNDDGIPKAVLTYEIVATEAGDIPLRALVCGHVNRNRLVIHADGDDANVDVVEIDGLRNYAIVAFEVSQLDRYDNPQTEVADS